MIPLRKASRPPVLHGLLDGEDRLLDTLVQLLAAAPHGGDEALPQAAQVVADRLGAEKVDVWVAEPEARTGGLSRCQLYPTRLQARGARLRSSPAP
jgi:hypothetical protein